MTPKEAVAELVAERLLKWRAPQAFAKKLFEAVQATAKADECRRCAARMQWWADQVQDQTELYLQRVGFAEDLLTTGGLEAES